MYAIRSYYDDYRGLHGAETTVSLEWILERGVRERMIDAAQSSVALGSAEIEVVRLDAAAETARRFVECLLLQASYNFV